jgi:glutathione S-transferase
VLQIGADVYIDSQRIAAELEARFPQPTLFPGSDPGLARAGVKWADAFFRCGLHFVIATTSTAWPEEFRRDRQALFPDVDFAGCDAEQARAQLRAHAALVEDQLADGRAFLGGAAPGLWDVHAWTVPWFTRGVPGGPEAYAGFERMAAWEARVAALGEGRRIECSAQEAIDVARASAPAKHGACDAHDVQSLRAGERVEVAPDDTQRGGVQGTVVAVNARGISVLRTDPRCGDVVVHFPRLGYRVTRL